MWKEVVTAYLNALSQNFPTESEEEYEKPQ